MPPLPRSLNAPHEGPYQPHPLRNKVGQHWPNPNGDGRAGPAPPPKNKGPRVSCSQYSPDHHHHVCPPRGPGPDHPGSSAVAHQGRAVNARWAGLCLHHSGWWRTSKWSTVEGQGSKVCQPALARCSCGMACCRWWKFSQAMPGEAADAGSADRGWIGSEWCLVMCTFSVEREGGGMTDYHVMPPSSDLWPPQPSSCTATSQRTVGKMCTIKLRQTQVILPKALCHLAAGQTLCYTPINIYKCLVSNDISTMLPW